MTTLEQILGHDAAVGQPSTVRGAARRMDEAGEHVARLSSELQAVDALSWRGPARGRFERLRDQTVVADLQPPIPAFDSAAQALTAWAIELQQLQNRGRSLVHAIEIAEGELAGHRSRVGLADVAVGAAKAATVATGLNPAGQAAAQDALRRAKQAQAQARAAQAASERELARFRQIGHQLREEVEQAARKCAATLDASIPPSAPSPETNPGAIAGEALFAIAGAAGAARRIIVPGDGQPSPGQPGRARPLGPAKIDPKLAPPARFQHPNTDQRGLWNSTSPVSPEAEAFVQRHNGVGIDWDGSYGNQCVDLFNQYNTEVLGEPFRGGDYAHQLLDIYGEKPGGHYSKVAPDGYGMSGDFAIFGADLPGSGGAGHVALVLEDLGDGKLRVFHQNWPAGSAPHEQIIDKAHLIGYLRPKG